MRISDIVAERILQLLDSSGGIAEIQRNELASLVGCVPSQINYVLTSRFTPEQGYIIKSRRGGGGYIKITRIKMDESSLAKCAINSVGEKLDAGSCENMVRNMVNRGIISYDNAKLILCATSDRSYGALSVEFRDIVRASLFKNMLLIAIENEGNW